MVFTKHLILQAHFGDGDNFVKVNGKRLRPTSSAARSKIGKCFGYVPDGADEIGERTVTAGARLRKAFLEWRSCSISLKLKNCS